MPFWRVALSAILVVVLTIWTVPDAFREPRFGTVFLACLVSVMAPVYVYATSVGLYWRLREWLQNRRIKSDDAP